MDLRLKAKRVEKGIQQKDFAKLLGVTPQYVHMLENGKAEPRRNMMVKISEILNTPIQELFFNE